MVPGRGSGRLSQPEPDGPGEAVRVTLRKAAAAHQRDQTARNLAKGTRAGYRWLLLRLVEFAQSEGVETISAIDAPLLRRWRASWEWKPSSRRQHLVMLKAFFSYAAHQGWVNKSPAARLAPPDFGIPHPS